ncbi:hypothetical protein LMG27177_02274 [Paraburkholderia fynbosensis]|uniref:Uncharacterized protein n=1 Tax=Paraburkholderia fynbosensis TaxID=1200993 RepID=A0A6J5FVS9_9BURK|nr:hypothetical protein LMG27177_02274 [Paraburkholderia fynbosensis]
MSGNRKSVEACRCLRYAGTPSLGNVSHFIVLSIRSRDESIALATTIAGYSLPVLRTIKESGDRKYESSLIEGIGGEAPTAGQI